MERQSILNEEFDNNWIIRQKNYYNYCTLYRENKVVRKHGSDDVCFSYLTGHHFDKMVIRIPKNYTFYTKSDIIEYLEFIRLFGLKLNFSTKLRNCKEYYSITVTNIETQYHAKIFATLLRNIWEEYSYQLSAVPYWTLYAHKTYKELNFLQCIYLGHLFRYNDVCTTGGHTVVSSMYTLEIDTKEYFEQLANTTSVHYPFQGRNKDLYEKIYTNKIELEQLLKQIKWIN